MYRSIPKKNDHNWIGAIIMIPFCLFAIVWIVIKLYPSSDNPVWVDSIFGAAGRLIIMAVCVSFPVLYLFMVIKVLLDSSSVFSVKPEGLLRCYKTGRKVLIPWTKIEDACACCTYGEAYRVLVFRFCLDKRLDERVKGKTDFWMPWPKRLGWRYMSLHRKKILTFEYTEEGEREVSKYCPSYYRDESILPWLTNQ